MTDRHRGWAFVAVQFALLAALVALPPGDDWARPVWLQALAILVLVAGVALIAVSALGLGPALTATPVPKDSGELVTTGLFHYVRHPIYTGVILAVVATAIRSGNAITAVVTVALVAFFWVKSSWEETKLRQVYADYDAYAAVTGRFFPRLASLAGGGA